MKKPPRLKVKNHYKHQKEYFNKDLCLYDDYQQNFNAWRISYINKIKKDLIKMNVKNKVLLDIGAGSGYISVEMAKLGLKVYAYDISLQAIKNLNKHKKTFSLTNLIPMRGFAEKILLPNESVDYIVANAILEHIPDEQKAILEWKRVLKKRGKVFIVVPLKFRHIWPFFWPINYLNDRMVGHLRRYDLKDLKKKFNLKVKKVYYTGHFAKMCYLLFSRLMVGGIRKNLPFDEYFEKLDMKSEGRSYGASNMAVILQK